MYQKQYRNQNAPEKMLNIHEVADLMGVSMPTIRRWVAQGEFPAPSRFGRAIRWPRGTVLEAIAKSREAA